MTIEQKNRTVVTVGNALQGKRRFSGRIPALTGVQAASRR